MQFRFAAGDDATPCLETQKRGLQRPYPVGNRNEPVAPLDDREWPPGGFHRRPVAAAEAFLIRVVDLVGSNAEAEVFAVVTDIRRFRTIPRMRSASAPFQVSSKL